MAHRSELTVRFNELDPYNHVNHASYVIYLEVARTEALEACGVPIATVAARGFQLVVTRLDIRYLAPAGAGDRLTVTSEIGRLRRVSGSWIQRIHRGDEMLVEAEVHVAVTDRAGRPTRPPDWLFPALASLSDETAAD